MHQGSEAGMSNYYILQVSRNYYLVVARSTPCYGHEVIKPCSHELLCGWPCQTIMSLLGDRKKFGQ